MHLATNALLSRAICVNTPHFVEQRLSQTIMAASRSLPQGSKLGQVQPTFLALSANLQKSERKILLK